MNTESSQDPTDRPRGVHPRGSFLQLGTLQGFSGF